METKRKKKSRRGQRRVAPLEHRAYYTRPEVCSKFGLSDKRLAEAIDNDASLPMLRNGRNQIFPKAAFEAWFESAAARRLNVHAA
jgi:hypothetical protein